MATITSHKKSARLDLRMTAEQKEEVELAASLSGISLSQWSLESLLATRARSLRVAVIQSWLPLTSMRS